MGAGSSTNKGVASRSRYSSWGSSIDEAICGENALCGDYPDDDVEGFPLVSRAPSRRASIVTNPYIDATPRKAPRLRRAFSEGEASVRRAYTTDYSDNSDDPDTDEDYYQDPNMIRKSRSAVMHDDYDHDDFPNRPFPLAVTPGRYDSNLPPKSRAKRRRKKAPIRGSEYQGRRPFSPSQLSAAPKQKLPKKKNRKSSMPRPESNYPPRRYSLPETIPVTSHSRRYSAFENERDPFGNVDTPLYSEPIKKPKKSKPKSKSIPNVTKDDWLSDYHLPSQVPTTPKTRRKKSQSKKPKKKAPSYPTPQYSGLPQQYDQILLSAPPIRKGARIKAPASNGPNYAPTPFVVGRAQHSKTPYLVSHN
uniref:Uncharacterized protein n=1 Tax=Panagrolaimus sp. PS1159 TaxID=55785 RepID=A0AC35FSI4_9BILA